MGMVSRMAKRKVTYTLDAATVALAEQAARRERLSTSAWIERAARREAVRTGVGPVRPALADAEFDEVERASGEEDLRAAG